MNDIKIEKAAPRRDAAMDILRIVAAVLVVIIHVSADKWYVTPVASPEWAAMNIYDSFARSAVPLFFMISGAFMLKKTVSIKKLYLGKILHLVVIYLVWSVLYAVDAFGIAGLRDVSLTDFITRVVDGHYHLWFLPVLIGLYVLQPVLVAAVHFEKGKYTRYILACFLFFGILLPTLSELFGNFPPITSLNGKRIAELSGYSGYMILGYYLYNRKRIKIKPLFSIALFFGTVAISALISQLDALKSGAASDLLYGNFSLTVFLEAVLLFLLFRNLFSKEPSERATKFFGTLSTLTLGVYLVHPFILLRLEMLFGFTTLSFSPFLSIPVIVLTVTAASFLITYLMTKIPIIKKFWKN